jgi:hypothetical protein
LAKPIMSIEREAMGLASLNPSYEALAD